MKKPIAVLLTLVILTICLPAVNRFFPDSDGYIDRDILCNLIGAREGSVRVLDAVADPEQICPLSPHHQYGRNCVKKCESMAIANQIVEGAQEAAFAIKEKLRSIFGSSPRS